MVNDNLVGGWPTPLKNGGVKVSWDDDIPNWMEKKEKRQQTMSAACLVRFFCGDSSGGFIWEKILRWAHLISSY